ncbi:MAG: putative quinol monooxygenase [Pseudomonadota bacterium]|nr:putative quinol monooxygenase [Pseudomonadota bacterium]
MPLSIIAQIKAKPEHAEAVKRELLKLVPITRAEKGCIQYDLHQDNEDSSFFIFYENWETRDLWQTHMSAPHLDAYSEATEGKVESFVLNEMTTID